MKTPRPGKAAGEVRKAKVRSDYPFTAIVGQDEMKLALILNVIDASIGGVLIMGHRGTAKSTAVRGLAALLPEIWVVRGCPYRCDPADTRNLCSECEKKFESGLKLPRERARVPVAELPLGATEDRVCGTIDIERALKDGTKTFEPGLVARANRGLLYIDEVNLLEDHLVDVLLDVAVTGCNRVERESISIEHPARFVLIGSGNPEEGELRPQLLDRFGLHVEIKTENQIEQRVEIVERREKFENDRENFLTSVEKALQQLRNRITVAQKTLATVKVDRALLRQIAQLCSELKVDGHRGELTITRAARALAAFERRKRVMQEDVRRVAVMALRHRLRRDPLEETVSGLRIEQALERVLPQSRSKGRTRGGDDSGNPWPSESGSGTEISGGLSRGQSASPAGELGANSRTELSLPGSICDPPPKLRIDNSPHRDQQGTKSVDRRQRQTPARRVSNSRRGRYAKAVSQRSDGSSIALDATLRAAAAESARYQVPGVGQATSPKRETRHSKSLLSSALRFKQFSQKSGTLFIFAVDTSGSMALNRIIQAKAAALSVLRSSYVRRDSVAIIAFRGSASEVVLPPSRSMLRARRALESLRLGGGTPLGAGLRSAVELAKRARPKHGEVVLLLFTDGQANVSVQASGTGDRAARRQTIAGEVSQLGAELSKAGVRTLVVDAQNGFTENDEAHALARMLGAEYKSLQLKPALVAQTSRASIDGGKRDLT